MPYSWKAVAEWEPEIWTCHVGLSCWQGQITVIAVRLNFSFCQMGMIILRIKWLILWDYLELCKNVMTEVAHSANYRLVSGSYSKLASTNRSRVIYYLGRMLTYRSLSLLMGYVITKILTIIYHGNLIFS